MIVTVEVIQDKAMNLLADMERLDLIRINNTAGSDTVSGEKFSEQFAGALHLSDEQYEAYQNTLKEGRNEWRNIY